MTDETDEGGLRYAILALLDGREFERIQLDVNAVPDDGSRSISRPRDLYDMLVIARSLPIPDSRPPDIGA
jgi:hypothetical protein